MASKFTDLMLRISADPSKVKAAFAEINRGLTDVNRQAQATTGGFRTLAGSLQGIGAAGFASLTLPIVGVGVAALQMAGRLESAGAAFTTMTGSAQRASVLLEQIKQFAATTPFEFPELVKSSQKLLGFGFSAEKVIPTLRSIGNAVAAVGGSTAEIDRVTLAIGQIAAKGKLSAEEMNQLAETGLPVRDILAKGFGITTAALSEMTQKGLIPADKAIRVLLAGFDTRFTGALEAQSRTITGIFSNLKDQVSLALGDIGAALAPTAKRIATEFVAPTLTKLQELAKGFSNLSPSTQNAIIGATAFVAIAPVVIGATGLMIDAVLKMRAAMLLVGPGFSLVTGAIATYIASSSAAIAATTGLAAGFATTATAAAGALGLYGALAVALYKLGEAYFAAEAAQRRFEDADAQARGGIDKVRNLAIQRGGLTDEIKALDQNFKSGIIGLAEYSERLGAIVRRLTDVQGALPPVAKSAGTLNENLTGVAKAAKALEAVKLPEWARYADMSFERLLALTPNLTDAMKDLLREENFTRATAASKATTQSLYDLITGTGALQTATTQYLDALEAGMAEEREFAEKLLALDRERLNTRRDLADIPITSNAASGNQSATAVVQQAGELLRRQQQQRQEAVTAKGVYEQLAATQGKNSRAAKEALEDWRDAEAKAAGVTRTSFLEVSTVITNLSQGLARNIIEWRGFGTTVIGIMKEIGQSILSNLFQSLLKSSGLIEKLSGGLTKVLSKVPGLGKIFGGIGGSTAAAVSQTATAATGAATSAATSAVQATTAAVTTSLTSVLSAVGSLGSFATGIIGNVLAFKTGKDTARMEVTSRETFAEIFNLRRDEWTRHSDFAKWQAESLGAVNRFGDAHGAFLSRIQGLLEAGVPTRAGAAATGGGSVTIHFSGGMYGGPSGIDELADLIARRMGLKS